MIGFIAGFLSGLPVGGATVILFGIGLGVWLIKRALSQ